MIKGDDEMKINKLLFVAGAVTALGVVYALCKKHKMRLVAEVEDTMVKGCCGKDDSTTKFNFEETAEVDIGSTELKASMSATSTDTDEIDDGCGCDE